MKQNGNYRSLSISCVPGTVYGAFKCFIALNPTWEVRMDKKTHNRPRGLTKQSRESNASLSDIPPPSRLHSQSFLFYTNPIFLDLFLIPLKPRNSGCGRKVGGRMRVHTRRRHVCLPHIRVCSKSSGFQLQELQWVDIWLLDQKELCCKGRKRTS